MEDSKTEVLKPQNQNFKLANFLLTKSVYKARKESKKDQYNRGQERAYN